MALTKKTGKKWVWWVAGALLIVTILGAYNGSQMEGVPGTNVAGGPRAALAKDDGILRVTILNHSADGAIFTLGFRFEVTAATGCVLGGLEAILTPQGELVPDESGDFGAEPCKGAPREATAKGPLNSAHPDAQWITIRFDYFHSDNYGARRTITFDVSGRAYP